MFATDVYIQRRAILKKSVGSGLILFIGNEESPMNYADNHYHFRQDSTFLYYWGLNYAGLAAVIDVDADKEIILGNDFTIDQIVWMGPQPTMKELSNRAGVAYSATLSELDSILLQAVEKKQTVHFTPQYRAINKLKLERLLNIPAAEVNKKTSAKLIQAVVDQRSVKDDLEIIEIEKAVNITREMHLFAMRMTRPGLYEREVAGAIEGIALSAGGNVGYPVIFSIHGETLHNHNHGNIMQDGDIVVNDSGAETAMRYNGDITRTIPVSGKFSTQQKEIYQIVYDALDKANMAVMPGVKFRDIHLMACKNMMHGLKDLDLMKGDLDEAVAAGAYGIFFQCGLGHMMGMDVHDMEDLGEQYVGYAENLKRSDQFGLCYLRMARELQPGFVITVEPGIYFIPQLIERWQAEKRFMDFINYEKFDAYKDFGGVRLEDNLLVTESGYKILGEYIPKTIAEVEAECTKQL